jgi:chemotaxis protein methyltransferase WspC
MALADFEILLKNMIGLDAESIGASAVARAVNERQVACDLGDQLAYWECIQESETERQLLIEAVVVPETWFFRDGDAFAALGRLVRQEWMTAPADRIFRVLSVPCASGEEPYSIAMALQDADVPAHRFTIDAADISRRSLAQAQRAVYGRNSFRGPDQAFRERHFVPVADGYRIADAVRRQVHFLQANLLAPSFLIDTGPYDVVFCRNLLIYFDRETQERAIGVLTRLLAPEGVLFVGSSETGVFLNRDFVSAKMPMAFAFRRTAPTPRPPQASASRSAVRARRPVSAPHPVIVRPSTPPGPERPNPVSPTSARDPAADRRLGSPRDAALDEAYRLADLGHFAEAATVCEAYVGQEGPSEGAFYLLALVRDASGNELDAESFYRKVLYLNPSHTDALTHLALLMDRQGKQADGRVLRDRVRRLEATVKT